MCNYKSLAYFLDEIRKETAWQDGTLLTGLNFRFNSDNVLLVAKRQTPAGKNQVCFIARSTARECLRALWLETARNRTGVVWKKDKHTLDKKDKKWLH